jgi:hypothetical protein
VPRGGAEREAAAETVGTNRRLNPIDAEHRRGRVDHAIAGAVRSSRRNSCAGYGRRNWFSGANRDAPRDCRTTLDCYRCRRLLEKAIRSLIVRHRARDAPGTRQRITNDVRSTTSKRTATNVPCCVPVLNSRVGPPLWSCGPQHRTAMFCRTAELDRFVDKALDPLVDKGRD